MLRIFEIIAYSKMKKNNMILIIEKKLPEKWILSNFRDDLYRCGELNIS